MYIYKVDGSSAARSAGVGGSTSPSADVSLIAHHVCLHHGTASCYESIQLYLKYLPHMSIRRLGTKVSSILL